MRRLRLVFSKTGRAAYISHLDLMRVFQRAFFRAGVPARHTEGFNPHLYISIAQPLPVGMEGMREMLDFESALENLSAVAPSLNGVMPEGILALSCYEVKNAFKQIAFADYALTFYYGAQGDTPDRLGSYFSGGGIVVLKKSKSGERLTDISQQIRSVRFEQAGEGRIRCRAVLAAGAEILSPAYIAQAALREFPKARADFVRLGFLDGCGGAFE